MESIVKLGEVKLDITSDVKTTEDLKVLLRWGWGAETTNKMAINPLEELKVGDGIRVIVEKVVYVPDPVEETAGTEAGQEAVAGTEDAGAGTEAEPAGECECACTCECVEETGKTSADTPVEESAEAVDDTKTL
jgi:hypothetical protein